GSARRGRIGAHSRPKEGERTHDVVVDRSLAHGLRILATLAARLQNSSLCTTRRAEIAYDRAMLAAMSGDAVHYERDGAIGVLTLNRPDGRNSMTPELLAAFAPAARAAREDTEARAVVLTG